MTDCPICLDAKWVCEAHEDKPWGIEGAVAAAHRALWVVQSRGPI
jgi:hypothetical protein